MLPGLAITVDLQIGYGRAARPSKLSVMSNVLRVTSNLRSGQVIRNRVLQKRRLQILQSGFLVYPRGPAKLCSACSLP
ncbi:hypothetical protein GJ744_002940 [Endocarpon pusillum]|uniref:Uncharacterized protein n=1 Tax=Endocarpon pusillum TaxID=364733 RepID=A0A8H7E2D3_9EURO|nr:hypothetical protein GJ744_002940 [Endocarpon pusillum]